MSKSSRRLVHCLGDSHVSLFRAVHKSGELPNTEFKVCMVEGATNMGLANPNSKTQARHVFQRYLLCQRYLLTKAPRDVTVATLLGEVDCGFVIWYRAMKYGESVEHQFEMSLNNYFELLGLCQALVGENVVVRSVPLPSITDDQMAEGDVAKKRLSIDATQKGRTELTLKYNAQLERYCFEKGIMYLDIVPDTMDPETRMLRGELITDPTNHHPDDRVMAPFMIRRLKELGFD